MHRALEAASPPSDGAGAPRGLRAIFRNAGLLLGGRAANAVLGLAYIAVTARGLGLREMGSLVLINAFAQLIADVAKFQSWQTLLRYGAGPLASGDRAGFQHVLRFCLGLDALGTVLGVAVAAALAGAFARPLGWPDHATAAALYMGSVAFSASATATGLLRLFDRFDVLAGQTAAVGAIRLAGCALAFALHAPVAAYLAAWALGQVAGFFYAAQAAWRRLREQGLTHGFAWRAHGPFAPPGAWRFAFNTNLSATLDVAFTHLSTLLVGAWLSPAAAAIWRIGRQVAEAIAKPARLLAVALYPELARLREADALEEMWRLARRAGLAAGGVVGVLLLASLVFGPLLVSLILNVPASAASAVQWQVAALTVGAFALPLEPMLITLGRTGALVTVQALVSGAYLLALWPLVNGFGLAGAGAATLAAECGLAAGWLWSLRRTGLRG